MPALSHCLACSEWISGPCSYCACPFRTAAPLQRVADPVEGDADTDARVFAPDLLSPFHADLNTPGGASLSAGLIGEVSTGETR